MRLFYLVLTVVVGILILILAAAQFGASCSWYLIGATAHPVFVLLGTALLGTIMGCFFMLFLLAPKDPNAAAEEEEAGE